MRARSFLAVAAAFGLAFASLPSGEAAAQEIDIPSGAYRLDPAHASLIWSVRHLGLSNYTARFETFDATLTLDVENPENSSITATIDPTSVSTAYPFNNVDFDAEIETDAKLLNAERFPEITFTSTSVERTGPSEAVIKGDLTMLGVTQEVELEATLIGALASYPLPGANSGKPAIGFSAEGSLDRTQFGMNFLNPFPVGAEVTFQINAEFIRADE